MMQYRLAIFDLDGTCITFDRDYFGEQRHMSAIPGPFADQKALEKSLR